MKNKIIFILFMVFALLFVINPLSNIFAYVDSNYGNYFTPNTDLLKEKPQRALTLEEWNLSSDMLNKAKTNGYISTYIPDNKGVPFDYLIYISENKENNFFVHYEYDNPDYESNNKYIKATSETTLIETNYNYRVIRSVGDDVDSFNMNVGRSLYVGDGGFISNIPIYLGRECTETFYEPDDTIGDPSSNLQLSYQYNEDNTSCHIDATLKGGEFTDQIFYSNYQFDLEGKLKTKKPFPKAGIDITENQALYFQAEDKDGNIKAKNTMNIYGIGKLDPNNFIVNIDTSSQSAVIFSAKLLNDGYIYNSINCKISDTENLGILKGLLYMTSDFKEYNEIGQNEEYKIKNFSNDRKKITLYFQIKNKVTGKVMLTKSYDIDLKSTITESDFSTIDSGIINEGQDDEQIMTPDNDPNFGKNNGSLDFDWNFDTAKNSIEEFFTTAKEMFNLIINFLNQLPKWITIPLYTLFMMAIIIFVYHVIRG